MDITADLAEVSMPLGQDLVILVLEGRTKAIDCQYPPNTPSAIGPNIQHRDDTPFQERDATSSLASDFLNVEGRRETAHDDHMALDSELFSFDLGLGSTGGDFLERNDSDLDFVDLLNPQANEETTQYPSSGSLSLAHSSTPSTDHPFQVQRPMSSLNASIPRAPTMYSRSLVLRSSISSGPQRIVNLILHTLQSYPRMMLRHKTIPPFIHPHLISSDVQMDNMWPLNNCISLAHMIGSENRGSRKLFWKNVRLECEHLYEENLKLNRWELLAAMQALCMYLLIRLAEGETESNNYDFLLMATVVVIAKQLTPINITCDPQPLESNWRDWIFKESRRRLSVIYKVVNQLVHEPVGLCDPKSELIIAPLPARKQLWEAGDATAWKAEIERAPGAQTDFALVANGELVELAKGDLHCDDAATRRESLNNKTSSTSAENWQEWCSGMDGFGGLVMLTASLIA